MQLKQLSTFIRYTGIYVFPGSSFELKPISDTVYTVFAQASKKWRFFRHFPIFLPYFSGLRRWSEQFSGAKSGKAIFYSVECGGKNHFARVRISAFLGGEEAASIITHANGRRSLEAHLFATYKKEKKLQRHLILKRPFQRLIGLHVRGNVVKQKLFSMSIFILGVLGVFFLFFFPSLFSRAYTVGGRKRRRRGLGVRRREKEEEELHKHRRGGKVPHYALKQGFIKLPYLWKKVFGSFSFWHTSFYKPNYKYRLYFLECVGFFHESI